MEIRKITEETKEEYLQVLDRDDVENIGRKYYRGLALHADPDAHVQGAMIWKLVHARKGQKTTAQITCFYAKDQEAGRVLLTQYEKEIAAEGAAGSVFQFSRDREVVGEIFYLRHINVGDFLFLCLEGNVKFSVAHSVFLDAFDESRNFIGSLNKFPQLFFVLVRLEQRVIF